MKTFYRINKLVGQPLDILMLKQWNYRKPCKDNYILRIRLEY